ncbi:MAG: flippase-like domain-containing protein [Bradymonadales bacterium]|nr:flippase-like domain-containing protein [Bradymonadales bacterium]
MGWLVRLAIGLGISGLFLFLAVWSLQKRGVTWADVASRLRLGDYRWVLLYAGILFLIQVVRVLRWGMLLHGISPVPWRKVIAVGAVGQAAIALFPMRLGEAVRPWLITESGHIRFSQATATVVVERVVDGLIVSAMFLVTLYFLADMNLPHQFMVGARATTAVFVTAALSLVLACLVRSWTRRWVGRLIKPISPRLSGFILRAVDGFFDAMQTLARQPKRSLAYLAVTLATWIANGLSLLPIFWAFDQHLGVIASFTVLCVLMVGFMIPSGPAAAGTFNYAIVLALSAFLVDETLVGALAILLYVVVIGVDVAIGLVGLWLGRFDPKILLRASRAKEPPAIQSE